MAENSKKLHIAVFPWLAFGHMIPYLELSKLIAQKGHKVSFISTPRNIDRLPKLPPNLVPFLNFFKFPVPKIEKLPKNAEATIDVPYEQVKYLKIAQGGLKQSMSEFLKDSTPDFIPFDFTSYWIPSIAKKFNISTAYFSIFIAAFLGFTGPLPGLKNDYEIRKTAEEYIVPPKWVPFEATVAWKLFEVLPMFDAPMSGDEENMSDILLVRSCSEFEPEWLKVLEDIHQKPVFPIGQLPTTSYEDDSTTIDAWRWVIHS